MSATEDVNCCEHGDHPAPAGKRFCSEACLRCEHESTSENGCDGICDPGARSEWKRRAEVAERRVAAALTAVEEWEAACKRIAAVEGRIDRERKRDLGIEPPPRVEPSMTSADVARVKEALTK